MGVPIIGLSFFSNFKNYENFIIDKNLTIIFITTFFTAYITIFLFIKIINRIGFTPFVIYRILIGIVLLAYVS